MTEDIKNNMIHPNPGDIVLERGENGIDELGRYIVVNRTAQEPNAHYYYVEYDICILYYKEAGFDGSMRPGVCCTISSGDLMAEPHMWEIVVESGLSWDDPPVEQNVVINKEMIDF